LIRLQDGYARLTNTYDEHGNLVAQAFFDENDHPVLHKDGYAKVQRKYNNLNQLIEVAFFGTDGVSIALKDKGWASRKLVYDDRGNLIEVTFFDALGRLARNGYGYARIKIAYNELSREIARTYLDENDKPVHTQLFLSDVESKSKAERIGLRKGDFILSYDGKDPVNEHVFDEMLTSKGERPRELKVLREGKELSFQVDPGSIEGLTTEDRVPLPSKNANTQQAKR
jgi:YD repeat-containing protein